MEQSTERQRCTGTGGSAEPGAANTGTGAGLDNRGRRPVTRKRQILLAVLVLIAVVLSFAGRIAVQVYHDHRDVEAVLEAERLRTRIIALTAELARERGWSMALLGAHSALRPRIETELDSVRNAANDQWWELSRQLERYAARQPDNELLAASIRHLREDWTLLTALRDGLDGEWPANPGDHYRECFETITDLIGAARDVWLTLESPRPQELMATGRYQQIRDRAWLLSEYSGQERGLLSYFVSASQPLPEQDRRQLRTIRALIDHHQAELKLSMERRTVPEAVIDVLERMQHLYYDRFNPYREVVYSAVDSGGYLISGVEWIERATHAINSIVGVSEEVGSAIQDRLYVVTSRSQRDVFVTIGLLVLVCVVAVFIYSGVHIVVGELFEQKRLAEITLGSIGDGVITVDPEGRVEYLNPAAERITGWRGPDARGKRFPQVFPLVNRYTMEPEADAVQACIESGRVTAGTNDSMLVRGDGHEVAVFHSTAPIIDAAGTLEGAVVVFYDLLNTWSEQHLLSYHASHDSLTDLMNRAEFERCLHVITTRTEDADVNYALCYLDIDQFKVINDTCGHQVGDLLVRELTEVLRQHLRPRDIFARLGGDEFGILLQGCGPHEAMDLAERLRATAEEFRFRHDDYLFSVSLSIGVIPLIQHGQSPAQLLSLADTACFAAKEKGRNQVHVYKPDDPEITQRHNDMLLMTRVQQALESDGFELYCQPIVRVDDCSAFAVEILLRMKEREGVVVGPGTFIPAAERFGLMSAVDRWVIENSFKALAARDRLDDRFAGQLVSINLSGASLSSAASVEFILRQFEQQGVDPQRICFEVTETAAIANFKTAITMLATLRETGCRIALDDFGTGLSSFAYLRDLPIDFIKMGGGFVRDMTTDKKHEAMVQATHGVAVAMDVPMIAESVEGDEIAESLRKVGVEYMQGFGIARPMPLQRYLTQIALEEAVYPDGSAFGLPN